jgi:hypothetical protein
MAVSSTARPLEVSRANNCTNIPASTLETYAGIAPATQRAYRADLDHFEAYGGTLPATDAHVANYLADHASVLKASTLRRPASETILDSARGLQARGLV